MSLLIVRLVVFVLLFWAGWRLWQFWLQQQNNRLDQNAKSEDTEDSETMVPCAQCGVHLPKNTAIESGQRYFCCREHQELFDKEDKE